jgi:hypothetical protein
MSIKTIPESGYISQATLSHKPNAYSAFNKLGSGPVLSDGFWGREGRQNGGNDKTLTVDGWGYAMI